MAYLYGLGDAAAVSKLKASQLEQLANEAKAGVPGAAAELASKVASGSSTVEQAIWDAKAMSMREAAKKAAAAANIPYMAEIVEQAIVAALGPRPKSSSGTKPVPTATGETVLVDVQTGKPVSNGMFGNIPTGVIVGGAAVAVLGLVLLARRR